MDSRNRASPEEFLISLDFKDWMESGDLSGPQGRIKQDRLWQELIELLNSTGGGYLNQRRNGKSTYGWIGKPSKKALTLCCEIRGTAGGPSSRQALSDLEQRVLAIMGLSAVVGLAGIVERGFDNQPSSFQNTTDRTQDPSSDILLEMLPRHPSQSIEEMASGSLTILPPPSGGNSNPAPATSPVDTTSRGAPAGRRQRERTASPRQRRERAPSEALAASPTASTPRRRALFARRRRIQTPFERSTSEFVNVENRLKVADRERNLHQRKQNSFGWNLEDLIYRKTAIKFWLIFLQL